MSELHSKNCENCGSTEDVKVLTFTAGTSISKALCPNCLKLILTQPEGDRDVN